MRQKPGRAWTKVSVSIKEGFLQRMGPRAVNDRRTIIRCTCL